MTRRAGKPCSQRERLAVHADGDDGVAVVGGLEREPAGVAVDRATDDLVGVALHAGPSSSVFERDAEPAGVADQVAAERFDTQVRVMSASTRPSPSELVEVDLELARPPCRGPAGSSPRPAPGGRGGRCRSGRRRRSACRAGRGRRCRRTPRRRVRRGAVGGLREHQPGAGGDGAEAVAEGTAPSDHHEPESRESSGSGEHLTPPDPCIGRDARLTGARAQGDQHRAGADQCGKGRRCGGGQGAAVEGGRHADDAEDGEAGDSGEGASPGGQAEEGGGDRQDDDDADDQGDLVVGAEGPDAEAGHRGRRPVDLTGLGDRLDGGSPPLHDPAASSPTPNATIAAAVAQRAACSFVVRGAADIHEHYEAARRSG